MTIKTLPPEGTGKLVGYTVQLQGLNQEPELFVPLSGHVTDRLSAAQEYMDSLGILRSVATFAVTERFAE